MQTVFFGPFIGEFAWELLYWQGWVRHVSRSSFKTCRKIAASVSGREPFYPYVDEFWPLPQWFLDSGVSSHGYFADGWRGGYPGQRMKVQTIRNFLGSLRRLQRPNRIWVERPVATPNVEPSAEALLAEFKRRLPEDTLFFVPWKANRIEPEGLEFGVFPQAQGRQVRFVTKPIPFTHQLFEPLQPTRESEGLLQQRLRDGRPLLVIFPRCRLVRRADKNWPREQYVELIQRLQGAWPEFQVTICGEPGGTHFADGVPPGCLDLIQVPANHRMDIQVAALRRAVMTVGGMSGAMFVALAAGCPTLFWGLASSHARFLRENVMGTPMLYHTDLNPSVATVMELVEMFLEQLERGRNSLRAFVPRETQTALTP